MKVKHLVILGAMMAGIIFTTAAMGVATAGVVALTHLSRQAQEKASVTTTKLRLQQVSQALELYAITHTKYPSSRKGLGVVFEPEEPPVDGWGRPFEYLAPGPGDHPYELISFGRDGAVGGTGPDSDLRIPAN